MRIPRALLLLLALALLSSACGDDGTATSTTTGPDGGGDMAEPSDTGESDPESPGDASDMGDGDMGDGDMGDGDMGDGDMGDGGSTDAAGPFCALSSQANLRSAAFDALNADAAASEQYYRSMLALSEQGLEVAPTDIADAVTVQRDVLAAAIDVLEPAGWDQVAAFESLRPIFESPGFLAAAEELEDYDNTVCGFAPDDGPTDGGVPDEPPVDEPVDVPAEYQAYCEASFAASQADDLPFDADSAQTEAFYRGLVERLDELSELSPPELQTDLATLRANFVEVIDILAGADWDLDVGLPLVQEWAAGEAVDNAMNDAIDSVEAFDADVCGIVF